MQENGASLFRQQSSDWLTVSPNGEICGQWSPYQLHHTIFKQNEANGCLEERKHIQESKGKRNALENLQQ